MGKRPKPTDDPRTAQEKSRSVDERVEGAEEGPESVGTITSPAPGAHVPQWGIAMPGPMRKTPTEGRRALADERKRTKPPTT